MDDRKLQTMDNLLLMDTLLNSTTVRVIMSPAGMIVKDQANSSMANNKQWARSQASSPVSVSNNHMASPLMVFPIRRCPHMVYPQEQVNQGIQRIKVMRHQPMDLALRPSNIPMVPIYLLNQPLLTTRLMGLPLVLRMDTLNHLRQLTPSRVAKRLLLAMVKLHSQCQLTRSQVHILLVMDSTRHPNRVMVKLQAMVIMDIPVCLLMQHMELPFLARAMVHRQQAAVSPVMPSSHQTHQAIMINRWPVNAPLYTEVSRNGDQCDSAPMYAQVQLLSVYLTLAYLVYDLSAVGFLHVGQYDPSIVLLTFSFNGLY